MRPAEGADLAHHRPPLAAAGGRAVCGRCGRARGSRSRSWTWRACLTSSPSGRGARRRSGTSWPVRRTPGRGRRATCCWWGMPASIPGTTSGTGGLDLVPTKLVDTTYMETASDDWFADFDGDGIGDIPVGRLPVQTVVGGHHRDRQDRGLRRRSRARPGAAGGGCQRRGQRLRGLECDQVKAALPSTVWVCRGLPRAARGCGGPERSSRASSTSGRPWSTTSGTARSTVWHGNWLTTDDGPPPCATTGYPFVVSMTCLNGFFHDPDEESLAEALLEAPAGARSRCGPPRA